MKNAISGTTPADTSSPIDEVKGAIDHVEAKRLQAASEAGVAESCVWALRRLHELLCEVIKALQTSGPGGHPENIDAVMMEIHRVTALSVSATLGPAPGGHPRGRRRLPWLNAHRSRPARYVRRKSMDAPAGVRLSAKVH